MAEKTPSASTKTDQSSQKAVPKPTSFNFITFSNVDHMRDPAALSRIRRHAMRDIGLQRRKPKKRRRLEVELHVPAEISAPLRPAIGGGRAHTFFHIPVELDEVGRSLLANIWRDEGDCKQAAYRKDWFSVGLAHAATFNQVLANSEIHLEALRHPHRRPRETTLSIYYHQLALKTLRKQLEYGEVTDSTIGTVTGMIVYAEISGVYENWLPQRKGLLDVVNARAGGLDTIEKNEHLRATISWVEVRGAFMQDLPPVLPLPKAWLEIERRYTLDSPRTFPPDWPGETDNALLDIFQSLSSLSKQISLNLSKARNEETFESEILAWTNVIAHDLLTFQSSNDFQESLRLAILTFIAPIYRIYGASPIDMSVHIQKQHHLLSTSSPSLGNNDLKLWILCISAFEATEPKTRAWFVNQIAPETTREENIRSILWIPEIFDATAESLGIEIEQAIVNNVLRR